MNKTSTRALLVAGALSIFAAASYAATPAVPMAQKNAVERHHRHHHHHRPHHVVVAPVHR